jgi:hypothetical protein
LGSDTYNGCTELVVVFAWLVKLSQEGKSKGYRSKDHPGLGREEETDKSKDHEERAGVPQAPSAPLLIHGPR